MTDRQQSMSLSGMVQHNWPPTVSWSPMKVVVSCVLPHQGRALWDEHTATMDTGVLQLQVQNVEQPSSSYPIR